MLARNLHARQKHQSPAARSRALRGMLSGLRNREVQRLKDLVHSEAELDEPAPGDEVDDARRDEDMELHVSLIEIAEKRLTAIRGAFDRLDDGSYGICEACGEDISLERLRAMPMAVFCVDCQAESEAAENLRPSSDEQDEDNFFASATGRRRVFSGRV